MTSRTVWRFGRCELRLAEREIWVDGKRQDASPNVISLLIYLVQNRHRSLSLQELLDSVWPAARRSHSLLLRTVVLARRLIGDNAKHPIWIHNDIGFGYRFFGVVAESVDEPRVNVLRAEDTLGRPPRIRVGFLPLTGQIADESQRWVPAGLIALAVQSLQHVQGISVEKPQASVLRQLPVDADVTARVEFAMQIYGWDAAISGSLSEAGGEFRLDFEVLGGQHMRKNGSVCTKDVVSLAGMLAHELSVFLVGSAGVQVRAPSTDAFVNLAFARAMACLDDANTRGALTLLDAASCLDPRNITLELKRLRCRLLAREETCLTASDSLLQLLKSDVDPIQLGEGYELAAQALREVGGPREKSRALELVNNALSWYDKLGPSDASASARLAAGHLHLFCDDVSASRRLYVRALADARALGNLVSMARCRLRLAEVDLMDGKPLDAKALLDQAARFWMRLLPGKDLIYAQGLLAWACFAMGQFREAHKLCDAIIDQYDANSGLDRHPEAMVALACTSTLLGTPHRLVALANRCVGGLVSATRYPCHALIVESCLQLAAGDLKSARWSLFAAAIQEAKNFRPLSKLMGLQVWMQAAVRHGGLDDIGSCQDAYAGLDCGSACPDNLAGMQYCSAARLLLIGDVRRAFNSLKSIAQWFPTSIAGQRARLDSLALSLELGERESLKTFVQNKSAWDLQHPIGPALMERLELSSSNSDVVLSSDRRRLPTAMTHNISSGVVRSLSCQTGT